MSTDNTLNQGLLFQVLAAGQKEKIHGAALQTLQDVGVEVKSKQALEMLKKAGALIEGSRARIPAALVEKALQTVPAGFALYDRLGRGRLLFEGREFNFGPGPSTTYTIDPYSGERRLPRKQDTRYAARIMDGLENIDFVMDFGTIQDVPSRFADLHLFQALLENTTKPVVHWGLNSGNCKTIIDMGTAVAGSLQELQKRPFLAFFSCSNSPLLHTEESLQKLIFVARNNLPFVYVAAPSAGGTAPVTLAGTLVITLAECLSGLVVHQLAREGAPFAMGGVTGVTDMRTMAMSYGCPEFGLMHAALSEMAHYYNLPLWSSAGCTDSKAVDEQAAVEASASIMLAALSGANMIHDVGYTEGGNCSNPAMLVMADEIIGYTKRLLRGVRIDEEALALEAIKRVGPTGQFITDPHTYANFKKEIWFPALMDRYPYSKWAQEGKMTLGQKAMARARQLIETHQPEPLEPGTARRIERIIAEASAG